jgi:hypothetical protein
MHRTILALAMAGALALTPSAASAATGGTASLDKPFKWSGGPDNGLVLPLVFSQIEQGPISESTTACTAVETCDETLVKVDAADATNDLTINVVGHDGNTPVLPVVGGADLDLYVFKSDAAGAKGEAIGQSINSGSNENVTLAGVEPGFYLVQVRYYHAVQATYDATATLSVPAPPEPEETEE